MNGLVLPPPLLGWGFPQIFWLPGCWLPPIICCDVIKPPICCCCIIGNICCCDVIMLGCCDVMKLFCCWGNIIWFMVGWLLVAMATPNGLACCWLVAMGFIMVVMAGLLLTTCGCCLVILLIVTLFGLIKT